MPASSWSCLPYICYITVSTNDGNYMWLNENILKAPELVNKDPHMYQRPWRQYQWAVYSKQIKGTFGFILHRGESSLITQHTQNTFILILQLLHIRLLHRPALCCEGCECSIWPCWGKENTNSDGVRVTPETDRRCHRRRDPDPAGWHVCGSVARGPRWIFQFWASGASCYSSSFLHHHTVK